VSVSPKPSTLAFPFGDRDDPGDERPQLFRPLGSTPTHPKIASEALGLDPVPASYHISAVIDCTNCPDVERSAETLHGAWRVKGHRVPVQAILDNADAGATPEQIAGPDIYPALDVDLVRRILAFARRSR
jgi:uncharacterized protein (DUF433 family)